MFFNNYAYIKTDKERNKDKMANSLFKILENWNNESLWKIIKGIFLDFNKILFIKNNYHIHIN